MRRDKTIYFLLAIFFAASILKRASVEEEKVRRIVIATHGRLAAGYKDSIEMICGTEENITYMCFYTEGFDGDAELKKYMEAVREDDEVIVFTDMQAGSVNQKFFPFLANKNLHLITGINLPLVLEIVTSREKITNENIGGYIKIGLSELRYIDYEKIKSKTKAEAEESFFSF